MKRSWGIAFALGVAVFGCSGKDGKDGAMGPAGPKGVTGDAGPAGSAGPQGKTGAQGDPGAQGEQGPQGKTGAEGPPGPAGPAGEAGGAGGEGGQPSVTVPQGTLNASCMLPCHSFSGIVEQWKTSRHYATYVANLGGDEAETWTGNKPCGNCHAVDGVQQRLANNLLFTGTTGPTDAGHGQISFLDSISGKVNETSYAGQANVAVVGCATCHDDSPAHDPHLTGKDYAAGDFPLRVPSGSNDYALIEKSSAAGVSDGTAVKYKAGNACMWCHKSRKDVTNFITASNNIAASYWGPHEGPNADIFSGKGGYNFAGKTYANSSHTNFAKGCVQCHMPPVAENMGIGDHSFYPQLSVCTASCHTSATSFDVVGGQSKVKAGLQILRTALVAQGLLSRDGTTLLSGAAATDQNFNLDLSMAKSGVSADLAGALYNYFLIARASGYGVHNPNYVYQLLYDSVQAAGGNLTGLVRP